MILRWTGGGLAPAEGTHERGAILVADSWLVTEGTALCLDLHRERFLATALAAAPHDAAAFWDAAIGAIPRTGVWFPRVEVRADGAAVELVVRVREAPPRSRSVTLVTHDSTDPRVTPSVKGPSLERLEGLRAAASDADDIVILDPLSHVVEGGANAVAWWRGDILCLPAEELDRVDSVTARALVALATATGVPLSWEATTPAELEGLEVWALSALHGPRIVTRWIDGPATAELPGRLAAWRARLEALRAPLPNSMGGSTR